MADYIPFEIQSEIMKMLPIKSLIQFRSVSKPWKSLIDSYEFIDNYNILKTDSRHLLVGYVDLEDSEQKFVSIADDDTFPSLKVSLTVPISIKTLYETRIIGSSQGLFCFYSYLEQPSVTGTKIAVIWNPTIRKSVDVVVPNVLDFPYQTILGFGVCPDSHDPKLVKIWYNRSPLKVDNISCIPWQVEVFTLSSGAWRSLSINLPLKAITLTQWVEAIDRFIYWIAYEGTDVDSWYHLIMAFDMTSEEFKEIHLPDKLKLIWLDLYISKVKESLVVLEFNKAEQVHSVWMMGNGVPNLFTKLYTINEACGLIANVVGFRKSDEPIIQITTNDEEHGALFVYEPCLDHISYIGLYGQGFTFLGNSYTETLLLLDH